MSPARCPQCPAPAGLVCLAQATGHARFCGWAAEGGDRLTYVRDHARPAGTEGPTTVRPEVLARVREALAVNACKVRQSIGCNCADRSAMCFRSGLPMVVTRERCGECVGGK